MNNDSKIEAVIVNNVVTAVRITFSAHGKFFARQYAITEETSFEQCVKTAEKYRDRIMNRVMEDDVSIPKVTPEEFKKLKERVEKMIAIKKQVRKDVQTVLDRYQVRDEDFEYLNAFGEQVKKRGSFE